MNLPRKHRTAFSLIEALVAVTVVTVLAIVAVQGTKHLMARAKEMRSVSNFKTLGQAALLYVGENDGNFPTRQSGPQWPGQMFPYLDGNKTVFADPNAKVNFLTTGRDPLEAKENCTSYLINSFDDMPGKPKYFLINEPSQTIILATRNSGGNGGGFAMNLYIGDYNKRTLINQFGQGSYYLFADGSVRFVGMADYGPRLWMADKAAELP